MRTTQIDPTWWTSSSYQGQPMREILRRRDISAVFGFLASHGWSRAAIAAATGLSESRVRGVRQGRQQVTSYEVLERIADGLGIERGLIGLAYTDDRINALLGPTADGERPGPAGHASVGPIREPDGPGAAGEGSGALRHAVDGKLMVLVGEGAFLFGPQNQMVWLPSFYIDVTPVTNAEYARFVSATGHRVPCHWVAGAYPEELHDHPVVNITYRDAGGYAAWAEKVLPTVEQWEKAARGDKGNTYPWGDQPTPAKCNVRETGVGHTTPVGLYRSGVSPYGVSDLSGNVWEWCATETAAGRYALRGSAFTSPFSAAAAAATNDASIDMLDDDTGFRCALPTS